MLRSVLSEVIRPLSRRVGTAFGSYLLGLGVHSETTTQIVAGATALGAVLVDLAFSHYNRKYAK